MTQSTIAHLTITFNIFFYYFTYDILDGDGVSAVELWNVLKLPRMLVNKICNLGLLPITLQPLLKLSVMLERIKK